MNGLNLSSKFSDVNAGYSTMGAPELGGAFAAANSGKLGLTTALGVDLDNTLELQRMLIQPV